MADRPQRRCAHRLLSAATSATLFHDRTACRVAVLRRAWPWHRQPANFGVFCRCQRRPSARGCGGLIGRFFYRQADLASVRRNRKPCSIAHSADCRAIVPSPIAVDGSRRRDRPSRARSQCNRTRSRSCRESTFRLCADGSCCSTGADAPLRRERRPAVTANSE